MTLYDSNASVHNEGIAENNTLEQKGTKRRPYFRSTTPQQRRLLFETWQATGKVRQACVVARVSLRTFYYWKPRFDEGGYVALAVERTHAPKTPHRIAPAIAAQIIDLKQTRPGWGKLRIAKQVLRQNEAMSTLSPNTVRRVLDEAGLWSPPESFPND